MSVFRRCLAAASAVAVLTAGGVLAAPLSAAGTGSDVYRTPSTGTFLIEGHGYGHGIGMSQWGAYGAAQSGLTYQQILHFYYPHTTLGGIPPTTTIRVYLEGTSDRVMVAPRAKPKLYARSSAASPHECLLPRSLGGNPVTLWRAHVVSTSSGVRDLLQATTGGGTWSRLPSKQCGAGWSSPINGSIDFDNGGFVRLVRSADATPTPYRGLLRAAFTGASLYGVNVVDIEDYIRGVVPNEMPASWTPAAVQAQAVAARTYGLRVSTAPRSAFFDIYPDTRDQAYGGMSSEAAGSNAAVTATETTAGAVYVKDGHGNPAFTQFSASNGGWTAAGAYRYLPAQPDPYDGAVDSSLNPHSWQRTVSAATIESAYSGGRGALQSIVVTSRDGNGEWGGRILGLTLRFAGGDVVVGPGSFCAATGLLNPWFNAMAPPGRPDQVTALRSDATVDVQWQPPTAPDRAPVTGYRVTLRPGRVVHLVSAATRSTSFSGLTPGTDYTVAVEARSEVGAGTAATVTTKVHRLVAATPAQTAVTASQATIRSGNAGAVVLANVDATRSAYGAGPLAGARHAPVLLSGPDGLPAAAADEVRRVLPSGGTVYLLGPKSELGDAVRRQVVAMGYVVTRMSGRSSTAIAAHVATEVARTSTVRSVFEVSKTAPPSLVWAVGAAAAAHHGVVLLTDDGSPAAATTTWLADHPGLKRFAVGAAAQHADPAATAVTGSATAVATQLFPAPAQVGVVSSAANSAGLVASGRLAVRAAPLLVAGATALPSAALGYLGDHRAGIGRVDLVGPKLPYDDVESGVQSALVG
jgi:stage II sporulation protein D